ncbi:MAG: iron ABC transporter permease [Chloroflexi bacterium]|nr:iron ABC transporter permease [Chloroflexota bacterium]
MAAPSVLPLAGRALAILTALVTLIPLFYVVVYTVSTGWATSYELLVRPRVGELLWNTVRLEVAVVAASALFGVLAAWLTERSSLPLRSMWSVLLVAPLAIPSFVHSFAWVSLTSAVEGYAGAVLIVTLSHYPYVYLPVAAALRGLDPRLEESARSLGFGPWRTFWAIVTPQLRPSLLGGMLLVTLHLLAELGALEMLRFPTFTTAIYDQYQSTFNSAAANMLASVLVTACVLALLAELTLRGRGRYARIGAGTPRPATRVRLGLLAPVVLAGLLLVAVLSLGLPLAMLAYWVAIGSSTAIRLPLLVQTTLSSISLGLAGALIATALATPVAWLAVRRGGLLSTLTERATYVAHSLPGIVVALSLVAITIRVAKPIYQTTPLLLTAYVILFFPLALVSIRAALAQVPPVLDDVGRSLGSGPFGVLRRVTLPLIWPGLGAAVALVFIAVSTELTATLLLSPIGTQTLATRFWSHAESITYGAAAPYAAMMVAISAPMTYLVTRRAGFGRS